MSELQLKGKSAEIKIKTEEPTLVRKLASHDEIYAGVLGAKILNECGRYNLDPGSRFTLRIECSLAGISESRKQ